MLVGPPFTTIVKGMDSVGRDNFVNGTSSELDDEKKERERKKKKKKK